MKPRMPMAAPMSDSAAALLLNGYGADPPSGRVHGFGDGTFDLFVGGDAALVAAWRQHETFLRARAKAWGWTPTFWVAPENEYHLRLVVGGPPSDEPDTDDEPWLEEIVGPNHRGPYFYAEALSCAGPQHV